MANTLCAPTCFGFPTEGASAIPTSPVICKNGDLVVNAPLTRQVSRQGTQQAFNIGLVSGQTIPGASITPSFSNPFNHQALVIVNHEFAMSGTLYAGGTTGQFMVEGNDGRNFANDNRINSRYISRGYTMAYLVGAGASFTIGMLTRLEARDIRGGFRSLGNLLTSMTVDIEPRYP
jgi:hypothetical protein